MYLISVTFPLPLNEQFLQATPSLITPHQLHLKYWIPTQINKNELWTVQEKYEAEISDPVCVPALDEQRVAGIWIFRFIWTQIRLSLLFLHHWKYTHPCSCIVHFKTFRSHINVLLILSVVAFHNQWYSGCFHSVC